MLMHCSGMEQINWKILLLICYLFCLSKTSYCYGAGMNLPYPGAEYYWPLNEKGTSNVLLDNINKVQGYFYGAKFIKNERLGGAISFSGNLEWIEFPTEKLSDSIANPLNSLHGFSVAFWIRFRSGKHILSTGAFTNSSEGTGIQITNDVLSRQYQVLVRTVTSFWKTTAPAFNGTWCHMVLKWHVQRGLHLFLDEKLVASDKYGKISQQQIKSARITKMLTIARPPNLRQKDFGKFDMAHLAVWLHELTDTQASQTGGLVLQITDLDPGRLTCIRKKRSCSTSPCGWNCHFAFPDAVCLEIEHKICKAVGKKEAKSNTRNEKILTKIATTSWPHLDQRIAAIYENAVLYIHVRRLWLVDFVGKSTIRLPQEDKIKILRTEQLGKVVQLNGHDDCLSLHNVNFGCIKNPTLCEKTGFTLSFWLRNHADKEQYIAYSTDADTLSGTGFMIYHGGRAKNFTMRVKTSTRQWEINMHRMPFPHVWWHLLITWNKQSGLSLFVNGNFAVQKQEAESLKHKLSAKDSSATTKSIIIGCTNRSNDFIKALKEYGHFDFGHFAIWDRILSSSEVQLAYQASIVETERSKQCCKQKSGNDCTALPCHKFKDRNNCAYIFGNRKCICKNTSQPNGKCRIGSPLKICKDKLGYDCKRLTSQIGYCYYYQVEMEHHCPASCRLCDR